MQPKGFVNPKGANKVCKLQRPIYGLVQASRSWNIRFDELSKHIVLYRLAVKPVFTRNWVGALQPFWYVYVNDILSIGNDVEFYGKHKRVFERSFSKKDLGEAAYILSIKIYKDRSRRLIRLSMSMYLDNILKEFKMDQSKKEFSPELWGVKLSKDSKPDDGRK